MDSQIGPVQVNVGGIQVDSEEMLQRLTSRSREKGASEGRKSSGNREGSRGGEKEREGTPQKAKAENEALANFFAGLMKKERTGSPRGEKSGGNSEGESRKGTS